MFKGLIISLLYLLALSFSAKGQSINIKSPYDGWKNEWEWGLTSQQIENKLLSEPGWVITKDTVILEAYIEKRYTSTDNSKELHYYFVDNQLYRRIYSYKRTNQEAEAWNVKLIDYEYNNDQVCWVDKIHQAIIRRKFIGDNLVVFIVELGTIEGGTLYDKLTTKSLSKDKKTH